jgi:hypothetical protein
MEPTNDFLDIKTLITAALLFSYMFLFPLVMGAFDN